MATRRAGDTIRLGRGHLRSEEDEMNSAPRSLRAPTSLTSALLATMIAIGAARSADAAPSRPVLAYWAFNCFSTCGDANFTPETVSQATASMTSSFDLDDGVNESGTTLNAITPYEARAGLTLRTGTGGINNGRDLSWRVDASRYDAIRVSFAARRSAEGFSSNQFQYTLDGATYVNVGAPFDPGMAYAVVAYDLRHVRGLNGNPLAGFRIVFNGGSTASGGEFVIIDNLQVVGK
jgi:hypothetical protein